MSYTQPEVYCRKSKTWINVSFAANCEEDLINGFMAGHGGGVHGLAMCENSYRRINSSMLLRFVERDRKYGIISQRPLKKSELPAILEGMKVRSDVYLKSLEEKRQISYQSKRA